MKQFMPWLVRHLDVDAGIPALSAEPEVGGVFLVLWSTSFPLAHLEIETARLPMDACTLRREVIRALAPNVARAIGVRSVGNTASVDDVGAQSRWERLIASKDEPLHCVLASGRTGNPERAATVSVVVCTRDRPRQLERCLDSLCQLTRRPDQILVVDNSPTNSATEQLVARRPGIDYVRENVPGLDRARNAGVRASTGQIIAYVDDDVAVHGNWLDCILGGFTDASVMAVTGLVLPGELATEAQYLFEKHWGFNRGYAPRLFDRAFYSRGGRHAPPVWEIGAGANMAFRRIAFELLGGFDERLDAGAAGVAGDSEFWYRILFGGWSCRYEPSAVVFHWHRREMKELECQLHAYMRGHVAALLIQHARYGDLGNLRRLFAGLPKYYARTTLRALKHEHRARARTLASELTGCLAGLRYYLDTRQQEVSAVPSFASGVLTAARGPSKPAMEHDSP